jgi:predicted amidophosphoribosyltransferase
MVVETLIAPIPQSKRLLCGNCHKPLPLHFTYDYCPFCGTKIDGGIDCRKDGVVETKKEPKIQSHEWYQLP